MTGTIVGKTSVVIPAYNSEKTISETVLSVLSQTAPAHEIIIVNDGSTDNTKAIADQFAKSYPEIQVINKQDPEHRGVGSVRNLGFRIATGKYFLPLDADDLIAPEFIEKTSAVMAVNLKLGIVCTDLQYFGLKNDTIRSWSVNNEPYTRDMTFADECKSNNIPNTSLIRREAFEQVGGYNELLPGHEDWSLWISILQAKWQISCVHEPLMLYRVRQGGYAAWMDRNRAELDSLMQEIHGSDFNGSMLINKGLPL